MEFYAAMKKNEILSLASKWMELENKILSKVSQAQNQKSYVLPHMWTLFIYLFIYFLYSYVHTMIGSLLPRPPPFPLTPSLTPPPPRFQAGTVLPLSLILLKREYKH
jgi:hypothetical protein